MSGTQVAARIASPKMYMRCMFTDSVWVVRLKTIMQIILGNETGLMARSRETDKNMLMAGIAHITKKLTLEGEPRRFLKQRIGFGENCGPKTIKSS